MVYMGSKNRLAKYLVPIIQNYITEDTRGYLEPFVGGANMIDKIQCNNKIGCDIHKPLIALLNKAKDDSESLPTNITKEEYEDVKNNKESYEDWYVGLVGFCATFSGKYFQGYAKANDKRNRQLEMINNLKKQSPNLKNIEFKCCDFLDLPKEDIKGYVIYCDPPYKTNAKYGHTKPFPYEEFYEWCKEMSKNNVVLISEYNMPNEFTCIWEKETRVSFNSVKNSSEENKNRIERLYTYKITK